MISSGELEPQNIFPSSALLPAQQSRHRMARRRVAEENNVARDLLHRHRAVEGRESLDD